MFLVSALRMLMFLLIVFSMLIIFRCFSGVMIKIWCCYWSNSIERNLNEAKMALMFPHYTNKNYDCCINFTCIEKEAMINFRILWSSTIFRQRFDRREFRLPNWLQDVPRYIRKKEILAERQNWVWILAYYPVSLPQTKFFQWR